MIRKVHPRNRVFLIAGIGPLLPRSFRSADQTGRRRHVAQRGARRMDQRWPLLRRDSQYRKRGPAWTRPKSGDRRRRRNRIRRHRSRTGVLYGIGP
jgi:hypothetical protein